jgi:hypothetical protein
VVEGARLESVALPFLPLKNSSDIADGPVPVVQPASDLFLTVHHWLARPVPYPVLSEGAATFRPLRRG